MRLEICYAGMKTVAVELWHTFSLGTSINGKERTMNFWTGFLLGLIVGGAIMTGVYELALSGALIGA